MTGVDTLVLVAIALFSFCMSYLGATVGLVLGQFRVVLLTYALGSATVGGATSLAISTVSAVIGAAAHVRAGRVNLALLFTIGAPSALMAYVAARFAARADPLFLKSAIGTALLITGLRLLFRREPAGAGRSVAPEIRRGPRSLAIQVALGALLGGISGLVGLLLGSLRLPVMVRLSGISTHEAVGTNMLIGAITGISAGVSAMAGDSVDLISFTVIAPLTVLGSHWGARETGRRDAATLTRWVGYALVPTALLMLSEVLFVVR